MTIAALTGLATLENVLEGPVAGTVVVSAVNLREMGPLGVQDDALFSGIDDVEYSFRVARHGWKDLVVLDAVIYHAASRSIVPRSGLQVYYLFRNILFFRYREFRWYRNVVFTVVFAVRYVTAACLYRWITGRGKVNRGMFLAISDFLAGRMGECVDPSLCGFFAGGMGECAQRRY